MKIREFEIRMLIREELVKYNELKECGPDEMGYKPRGIPEIDAPMEVQMHETDKEEAQKRLATIEKKYGKTWKSKLKAFDWAKNPDAALADLMRDAGRDPKKS